MEKSIYEQVLNRKALTSCFQLDSELAYEEYVKTLAELITKYKWLHEPENVRFYSLDHWKLVPEEWKEPLHKLTMQELQQLSSGFIKEEWPTSLKDFILNCFNISIPRKICTTLEKNFLDKVDLQKAAVKMEMSPKKVHEVERMSFVTSEVCNSVNANTVVDIGAGEGYISYFLVQKYKKDVIAIEANANIAESGEKRAEKLSKLDKKRENRKQQKLNEEKKKKEKEECKDCENTLNSENTNTKEGKEEIKTKKEEETKKEEITSERKPTFFAKALTDSNLDEIKEMIKKNNPNNSDPSFAFIGLHTCGNLANMVLELFLKSQATALINVGCCFHVEIDEGRMGLFSSFSRVFPLSKIVKQFKIEMDWSSMKTATQAAIRYTETDESDPAVFVTPLFYRAVVETVLGKYFDRNKQGYRIKKIPQWTYKSFSTYINELGSRFCLRDPQTKRYAKSKLASEELIPQFEQAHKELEPQFDNLKIWVALQVTCVLKEIYLKKMVVSPVLESMVLLDRMLYLNEHPGVSSVLIPIFDANISPRNLALIAIRSQNSLEILNNLLRSLEEKKGEIN